MIKNQKLNNKKSGIITPIKESEYINTIISKNIINNFNFKFFNFNKIVPTTDYNLKTLIRKINYICLSKSNFIKLNKESYLDLFLNLALFLLEFKTNIKVQKKLLLNNYILLLHKIFLNKKLSIRDISILIKFLTYSSTYRRKEISANNINLLEKLTGSRIKSFETIKLVIDIIKILNIPMVTIEFCEFLNAHFLMNKYNIFFLTETTDLLELLFLNDQNDFVLDCLSKIYSFRTNKSFLNLFFEKIKDVYKERRDKNITKENETEMNNSLMTLLNNINRSILYIKSIKQNEENKDKEDSYFPEKGFIFSNNKNNGLSLDKIIVRNSLTIVFSFNYSPYEQQNPNINQTEIEYPIIFACSNSNLKDSIYFYIKDNIFYYKQIKSNKLYPICNIKKNQTYLCYYSIKEHENFVLAIKSDNFEFEVTDTYKDFLKKNLVIHVGRYNRQNFEGYMGPILVFKEYFDNEYKNYIFSLKGCYDRILYFYDYNTSEVDKFDKYYNYIINDGNVSNCLEIKEENKKHFDIKKAKQDKKNKSSKNNDNNEINNRDYFLNIRKKLKEKNALNSNLMFYISPLFSNSALNKNHYTNGIFTETLIKKVVSDPKRESSTVVFYKSKPFIFQFLKYDGICYLIMSLELIMANYDNIKTKSHEKVIIDIFQCIIIFITGLLSYINIESYYSEIRKLLFCIKKFFNKFNKYKAIGDEIYLILNNIFQNLDELNKNNYTENKKYCINVIKNEICKILLNAELYDLNNFSLINKFMNNLYNFIQNQNNTTGLLNIKLFNKITNFAIIYEKINIKNSKIKHDSQFKLFRNYFSKIIINYVQKSELLEIYKELYNIFSNDLNFNYLKYQFIKIFYLVSENYFNTIDEETLFKSWKYFIDLFDYLEKHENHHTETDINEKEQYIIMSLCLRIILENIKYKEFFKLKIKVNKDENNPYENLLLKTKEEEIKKNINSNLIYKLISSGYWTESQNFINDDKNKSKKKYKRLKSFFKIKNDTKFNLANEQETKKNNYDKKRNYSVWGAKKFYKNKNCQTTNNPSNYNTIQTLNNTINFENEIKNIMNKKSKYLDYCSYHKLFIKLCKSCKLNDYCFKAMLLYVLEKNNKVNIPENIKLNFILKVKKYEQLENPDYKSFLCIKYYTQEIKKEFKIFIKIIENNKNKLSNICYDILLYILIQIIKDREHTRNICTLFLENQKICNKLFKLAFLYNKQSGELFIKEFSLFIKLALPYHRKIFIAYLLYESIFDTYLHNNYSEKLFNIFLTTKSDLNNNNRYFYDLFVNKVIILYHIFKSDRVFLDDKIDLDEKGLLDLAEENLLYIKYDILYTSKRKCYVELLYNFFLNLYIKSNNKKYGLIMNKIFIEEAEKIKKKVKGSKTILFYIDKLTIKEDKKNPCLKFYNNKNYKIENSLCINLLMTTLKYWCRANENNEIKEFLQNLIICLFEDSKLIFKENKIFQKKDKNNVWYNFLLENLNEIVNNNKEIKIENIQKQMIDKYNSELKSDSKNKDDKNISKNINSISFVSDSILNLSTPTNTSDIEFNKTNDSISDNEKENKNEVTVNETMRTSITKIKDEKNNIQNNIPEITPSEKLMKLRHDILGSKNQYKIIKNNFKYYNYNYIDECLDIENIDKRSKVVIFPKNTLLEQRFSLYFTDILFYNKLFVLMKNYYKYYIKQVSNYEVDINNYFNYPTIIRNYTPTNIYFGEFFVKNDLNFFYNRLITISHSYFKEKMKKYKIKDIRLFPKKTEQDDIHNFLVERQINDSNIFYVDLITNRNVVFGQLIVSKNMVYFENLNKEEFLKNKTDSAKEKWLLCSLDCDYAKRVKKIYIFKSEISQIINRRFLYLFQACELFLKNGKSYYFNFYSEQKKIQFFSIFKKDNTIDVIYDLKSSFKKKNFTNQWLTNELSTLEYLLLLNKYSSRSYNDINQYPVFPWLEIYGGKVRDLKYTTAAQTEDERLIKKEMYLASSEKFPYHYTTHFSNSAYLAYYLVRTNPFTNNQINLQVNKFDNPMRQFNAIDEILKILKHTSQPREVIPEFFLSTEFYYNYNCNFYGITDEGHLINNLNNKEGFKSPLEYILHNALLLEAPQTKSEINYFFDNIYGVGQMGGADGYNTYDKYSYQEMFDLKEKIDKYKQQNLNYNKIKQKIISKCNKIISFGQTPFKLLEDKHPQWATQKEKNENSSSTNPNPNLTNITSTNEKTFTLNRTSIFNFIDEEEKNFFGLIISANILFFDIISNIHKDNSKQNILILNKLTKFKYELKFYDNKFRELSSKNLIIPKEIKLYSKLKIFKNNFLNLYKYNPKNIMIHFKLSIFIFCHFNDNSFKIFSQKGDNYSIMTESMITCITKISDKSFLTGHFNGKIIGWELQKENNEKEITINDFNKLNIIFNFIAHKSRVNNIIYSHKLDLIISNGDDKKIFIRKSSDLSLLTMIDISNKICIELKLEHYYIYVLSFDEIIQKHIVEIYSLNGILVGKSDYDYINNINFDKEGNLLIGYYKKDYISIFDPSLCSKLGEIHLLLNDAKILSNDKKTFVKLSEDISIGDDILFMNFCYNKYNNSIYGLLSNKFLFCKNLNNN